MTARNTSLALLAVALAAMLAAFPAAAQRGPEGPYFGASIGVSKVKTFCTDPAWFGGVASCDNNGTAARLLGGYQFSRNFAIEAGYHSLGKATVPGANVKFDAIEASTLFLMPFGDFSVFGRLGLMRGTAKAAGGQERNNDLTYGAGVQFEVSREFAVRGEWQRYPGFGGPTTFAADTDVDAWSLGVVFRF